MMFETNLNIASFSPTLHQHFIKHVQQFANTSSTPYQHDINRYDEVHSENLTSIQFIGMSGFQ